MRLMRTDVTGKSRDGKCVYLMPQTGSQKTKIFDLIMEKIIKVITEKIKIFESSKNVVLITQFFTNFRTEWAQNGQ